MKKLNQLIISSACFLMTRGSSKARLGQPTLYPKGVSLTAVLFLTALLTLCQSDLIDQNQYIVQHRDELITHAKSTVQALQTLMNSSDIADRTESVLLVSSSLPDGDHQTLTQAHASLTKPTLVVMQAGTYAESVRLDKPMTLAAVNGPVTIGVSGIVAAAATGQTDTLTDVDTQDSSSPTLIQPHDPSATKVVYLPMLANSGATQAANPTVEVATMDTSGQHVFLPFTSRQ